MTLMFLTRLGNYNVSLCFFVFLCFRSDKIRTVIIKNKGGQKNEVTFLQNSGPGRSLKASLMTPEYVKTLMSLVQEELGTLTNITALFYITHHNLQPGWLLICYLSVENLLE